ncbi:response regulator [Roseiarcaceae bacterium H3SJ34-1]|uniref:ATP-binding protein n=1 Tax=Terripilifer ovatus TaxID=3032367 RepID=UPI003AB96AFA|nr:response regulator [Roseiarcaceae bacterium H3SJ34-1]
MSGSGRYSERALILAPVGRDHAVAAKLLTDAGFLVFVCPDLAVLCHELARGAGVAVIADEAIAGADLRPLADFLNGQPPWSDFPIVLMTHRGGGAERNPTAVKLAAALGNVTFLERPFHPTTMISVARSAIRGRLRQYEARSHLNELTESEERLQTALKAGNLGSWTLDIGTMTLHASEAFRHHFGGLSGKEFLFDDFRKSVHPDERHHVTGAIGLAIETGSDLALEHRTVWPDGSVHWIDIRARATRNESGKISQLVGVSSDITERKTSELERERLLAELAEERTALSELTATLEQRVQERTRELVAEVAAREHAQKQLLQSQKMESIGQLTGGVAHDFNNLLMAVMGNLELLAKRIPDDARMRRLLDGAMQGARRGASLTQRMLAFSRQQDLKTSSIDMAQLVLGMRDLLERSLGPRFDLRLRLADRLPAAQVDANQIELAILNLAINSRDAMPNGGQIAIDVSMRDVKGGKPVRDGRYVLVQVEDTGTGMDAETLNKSIEPFFSTKPLGKGTGLGLSMVHGLVVQLGGHFELASEVGKGTTACLWLPVANELPTTEKIEISAGGDTMAATILVVDDDPLIAMSTVDMLEDLGHKVIEANSAKQALEILQSGQSIDLLMTDQAMPGMTGTELIEMVRPQHPDLPVLLATGYADLPAGKWANLPRLAKPYQQAQLEAEVGRLLSGRAAAKAS